ncbi:MAG: hypothetical protein GWN86_14290, partial [Desulfobacterales bacterium]|nr:hypothetical protein [Desulfobacterales bacterium]
MNCSYVNKLHFGAFLFCILLSFAVLSGCAGLKQGKEVVGINTGDPILVASLDANRRIWCGTDTLVYIYGERDITRYVEMDVYLYDVHTGRKVLVGKDKEGYSIVPMACTPDGRWLVYRNTRSFRWEESIEATVMDVWRYETSTGRHEKIAIAYDVASFYDGILSPDGKKLLLGKEHALKVEMPEPKWEIVWTDLKNLSDAVWLPDSSAVLTSYWGRLDGNNDIVIEVVTPERKTVIFNPEELNDFNLFYSDKEGRIYVYFWDIIEERHLARCNVDTEKKDLSCEDIFVEGGRKLEDHEVFSDGEAVAFTEDDGTCVKALRIGEEKARCITPPIDTLGNYKI